VKQLIAISTGAVDVCNLMYAADYGFVSPETKNVR
jgi:hypothetical protein